MERGIELVQPGTGAVVTVTESSLEQRLAQGWTYPRHRDAVKDVEKLVAGARVACTMASRGRMMSLCVESVFRQPFRYGPFFAHGMAIPDCFEKIIEEALQTDCTHILNVEDDMLLPPSALERLLLCDTDVVSGLYVAKTEDRIKRPIHGPGWVPMGCLLVRREVFERLARPWFRTDVEFTRGGGDPDWTPREVEDVGYGRQDVYFSFKAREAGFSVSVTEDVVCGHVELREAGAAGTNEGGDTVRIHYPDGVKEYQAQSQGERAPAEEEVVTSSGHVGTEPDTSHEAIEEAMKTKTLKGGPSSSEQGEPDGTPDGAGEVGRGKVRELPGPEGGEDAPRPTASGPEGRGGGGSGDPESGERGAGVSPAAGEEDGGDGDGEERRPRLPDGLVCTIDVPVSDRGEGS